MFEANFLTELRALALECADKPWVLHENKIDDITQKWVIYQVGFDAVGNKRLKLLADIIGILPDLLTLAEKSIEKAEEPAKEEPKSIALIQSMIDQAVKMHENKKHSALSAL